EPLHARRRADEHGADGVRRSELRPQTPGDGGGDRTSRHRPPDQLSKPGTHHAQPRPGGVESSRDTARGHRGLRTMSSRLFLGAAIGDCVHVAGVLNFLAACRRHGHRTEFLGPAVSIDRLVDEAARRRPDILAVSYRLTPEAAERLFTELASALKARGLEGMRAVFGGPPPVAEVARRSGLFELVFGAVEGPDVEEWLSGEDKKSQQAPAGRQDLLTRRRDMGRRPLIRHHFGLPTLERTVAGIEEIARSGLVDVISIAPDQNAQEHFFHPERMDPAQDGAGGVPVRTADDFRALHKAAQAGNYPLLRCYSGTNDLVAFGEMLRSEERRVGKECRSRWSPYHEKKK